MAITLALVVQFVGLLLASRLLRIRIGLLGVLLITLLPLAITYFLPGLGGFAMSVLVLVGLLKASDATITAPKITGMVATSIILQILLFNLIVQPAIEQARHEVQALHGPSR